MKTMKYLSMAVFACLLAACDLDNEDNAIVSGSDSDSPTQKEKDMVPSMMMWQLDSMLVINNPGTLIETYKMLYAGQDTYQWTYAFYPYTYKFPDDLVFYSDFDDGSVKMFESYKKDYCKYTCDVGGEIVSAGYLCYYKDFFTFEGLKQGCWVEFMLREASTNWDTDVWTCSYNTDVDLDGTVLERTIEYYSPVKFGVKGGASVAVNGTTFSVYNAYWDVNVANGNDTFYTLQFYNFDKLGGADPMDIVTIIYKVTGGGQTAPATGEFTDFDVSVTRISSNEAQDKQYYTYDADNPNAKLKVTKNGSGYLVQFGAMKYTDGNSTTTYNGTAFSFAGSFTKGTLLVK